MSSALAFPKHGPCSGSTHYLALHTQVDGGTPISVHVVKKPCEGGEKAFTLQENWGPGGWHSGPMSRLGLVRELVLGVSGSDYNDWAFPHPCVNKGGRSVLISLPEYVSAYSRTITLRYLSKQAHLDVNLAPQAHCMLFRPQRFLFVQGFTQWRMFLLLAPARNVGC